MIAFLAGEPDRLEDSVSLALQRRCLAFRSREDLDLEDQCFRAHVDADLLPARTDAWRHARSDGPAVRVVSALKRETAVVYGSHVR
jgi:hypothetical protein